MRAIGPRACSQKHRRYLRSMDQNVGGTRRKQPRPTHTATAIAMEMAMSPWRGSASEQHCVTPQAKRGAGLVKVRRPIRLSRCGAGTSRIFVGPNLISVRGLENRFRASYPQPMRCCTRQDEATPALQGLRTQVEHNGAPCGVCIAAKSTRHFYAYD